MEKRKGRTAAMFVAAFAMGLATMSAIALPESEACQGINPDCVDHLVNDYFRSTDPSLLWASKGSPENGDLLHQYGMLAYEGVYVLSIESDRSHAWSYIYGMDWQPFLKPMAWEVLAKAPPAPSYLLIHRADTPHAEIIKLDGARGDRTITRTTLEGDSLPADAPLSAQEAAAIAQPLVPDGVLWRAHAIESERMTPIGDWTVMPNLPDAQRADGRATAWHFEFARAEANTAVQVGVFGGEAHVLAATIAPLEDGVPSPGALRVRGGLDSTAAVDVARLCPYGEFDMGFRAPYDGYTGTWWFDDTAVDATTGQFICGRQDQPVRPATAP